VKIHFSNFQRCSDIIPILAELYWYWHRRQTENSY